MLFFTISAVATATALATSDSPTIASVLTSINVGCLRNKCMNSIEECDEGSTCHKKLSCVKGEPDLADAVGCFKDVKWPHIDNGLVQILDCGQHEKCMPMTNLGTSLLETERTTRNIVPYAQKMSLLQEKEKESPTIASVLTSINVGCLRNKCMNSIEECDEGSTCHKKLSCVKGEPDLADAVGCFKDVKWPHIDNGLVQILDCGQHEKCMPMTNLGMSLLETELKTREIPSMEQKESLIQLKQEVESNLNGKMMQSAHTIAMMKAHLGYMAMAGKAVKQTTSLIQEVAKDETLEPEEKMQALDHLSAHLKKIQSDVASQQMKVASLMEVGDDELTEEDTEKEEDKAEEKPAVEHPESLAQTGATEGNLRHGGAA